MPSKRPPWREHGALVRSLRLPLAAHFMPRVRVCPEQPSGRPDRTLPPFRRSPWYVAARFDPFPGSSMARRLYLLAVLVAAIAMTAAGGAHAHPHVWVTMKSEVVY